MHFWYSIDPKPQYENIQEQKEFVQQHNINKNPAGY